MERPRAEGVTCQTAQARALNKNAVPVPAGRGAWDGHDSGKGTDAGGGPIMISALAMSIALPRGQTAAEGLVKLRQDSATPPRSQPRP